MTTWMVSVIGAGYGGGGYIHNSYGYDGGDDECTSY